MKKVKTEVKTSVVEMYCDCGIKLRDTGMSKLSDPPLYVHECPFCGFMHDSHERQDSIVYEKIEVKSSQLPQP